VWFSIWFYEWSLVNLGQNYATAFSIVSSVTGFGAATAIIGFLIARTHP